MDEPMRIEMPALASLLAVLILLSTLVSASAQQTPPVAGPQTPVSSIGYPTVAAALEALRAKSNVTISEQGGWTIVDDRQDQTIWSFTPTNHPAHPAAVKRKLVQKGDEIFIEMSALCHAERIACDKLVGEFQVLNQKVRDSFKSKR
jgi:hypothetical protein